MIDATDLVWFGDKAAQGVAMKFEFIFVVTISLGILAECL
jgi:hypothetical protein